MESPPPYNEAELLTRVSQGDQSAFAIFFHQHKARVYEIALAYTESVPAAEEITQDVFMRLWAHRAKLPETRSFAAWLYTLTRNCSFNALRDQARAARREKELIEHLPPAITQEGQELLRTETRRLIGEAMELLSPSQKQAFTLAKLEGLSREESAARMGISPNTFKVHLLEATRVVRAYLVSRDVFIWVAVAVAYRF